MYGASAYSAFTGLQWRRLREVGGEITQLKQELKGPKEALTAAQESESPPSAALVAQVSELEAKIAELTATRKDLASNDFRDKHYQVGSVVLGLGTAFAIEGPVNTFIRAQKLFPGPHLYAGAGIVVAWAMAASLVPLMSKGNDAARYGHMAFNIFALGLFTWQVSHRATAPQHHSATATCGRGERARRLRQGCRTMTLTSPPSCVRSCRQAGKSRRR